MMLQGVMTQRNPELLFKLKNSSNDWFKHCIRMLQKMELLLKTNIVSLYRKPELLFNISAFSNKL